MNCTEVQVRLNDYVDANLSAEERREVEEHVRQCFDCREELNSLRSLLAEAASLPKSISPSGDLWMGIERRIAREEISASRWTDILRRRRDGAMESEKKSVRLPSVLDFGRRASWIPQLVPIAIVVLILIGVIWFVARDMGSGWSVARLDGTPKIGRNALDKTGRIRVGEWLETDDASRAKIDVGEIGLVEVRPNTRIRLLQATASDHRLGLDHGTIHARIWAPPRLFFVETPSAVAIDLGCEYDLFVDKSGAGILHVTSGWVALEYGGRESIIPAGAMCTTRPGVGPGTPFLEDASERFRAALAEYDFEEGGGDALATILDEARNMDSITLWHLFFRTSAGDRARVYDRLSSLVPPPEGVTREGMLQGNAEMIKAWQKRLNLGMKPWWKFLQ